MLLPIYLYQRLRNLQIQLIMKRTIINMIIAVLFSSVSSFANNTNSITTDGTKTFIVDTKLWKSDYLTIEIRDNAGVLVFDDKYSTKKGKKFNLKNLPSGEYSILIANDLKSTKQEFVITSEEIQLLPNAVTIYKPVINVEYDHIDLNYLSNSNSVTISVSNTNHDIFNIGYNDQVSISKRFDIRALPKGNYTFNVTSGNNTYSKRFQK